MGKNHARILTELSEVEFVGFFDPILGDVTKGKHGTYHSSLEKLLSQELDYIVIATPTVTHEEISCLVLERGISVLLEKPVSHSVQSANRILESAKRSDVKVGIGHIERYNSAARELKNKIDDNFLGAVYQITTRRQGPRPVRISDVGVVKDLGTHDIDLVSWLLRSTYSQVYARTRTLESSSHEDYMFALAELENKTLVSHTINWRTPVKERKIIVTGDKGVLEADLLKSELIYYENGESVVSQDSLSHFTGNITGSVYNFSFDKPEPLREEHLRFREYFLGGPKDIITLEEGIETLRVADAIIKSGESNQVVMVSDRNLIL
jgi:predicted dehydrogenase